MKNKKHGFPIIWFLPVIVLILARNIDYENLDFSSTSSKIKTIVSIIIGLSAIAVGAYVWKDSND
jgi:hypothetical protein